MDKSVTINQAPLNIADMFRAIGFGITLVVIRVMMPEVFSGLEDTLVKFFQVIQDMLGQFPDLSGQTASVLPQAVLPR